MESRHLRHLCWMLGVALGGAGCGSGPSLFCDPACPAGEICAAGVCVSPDGGAASSGGGSGDSAGQTSGRSSTSGSGTGSSSAGVTGSTGGTTGNGCAAGLVLVDGYCVFAACAATFTNAACQLVDGGVGHCGAGGCQPVSLASDAQNCGGYGLACPAGAACQAGRCVAVPNDGGVPNCLACPSNRACLSGSYTCAVVVCSAATEGQPCTGGGLCCNSSCVAVDTDQRCGACGVTCAPSTYCQGDRCLPFATCLATNSGAICQLDGGSGTCCAGSCHDTTSDRHHCGACGQDCAIQAGACVGGLCQSFDAGFDGGVFSSCDGPPGCPAGEVCDFYACLGGCAAGGDGMDCGWDAGGSVVTGTCCGAQCLTATQLRSDPSNCGGCGVVCEDGGICSQGDCQLPAPCSIASSGASCALGAAPWNGVCCSGNCVDLTSNASNCGGCGALCPLGASCAASACSVSCQSASCPGGTVCLGDSCAPLSCDAALEGQTCARAGGAYGECCAGQCADTSADASNCGGCDRTCPSGASCEFGDCVSSPVPFVLADCTAPAQACPAGRVCSEQGHDLCLRSSCNGLPDGVSCAFGVSQGAQREGLCCGGSCVDPSQDPANCLGCGNVCAGVCLPGGCLFQDESCLQSCPTGSLCVGGACLDGSCAGNPGALCGAADGARGVCCGIGLCADLASDPANCGACGAACPAGQTCAHGACSANGPGCGPGRNDGFCAAPQSLTKLCCSGSGCTDTAFDALNCGGCGVACAALETCDGGRCVIGP